MTVLFLILAGLTLTGAVAAMTLRRLVHCALALTVAFVGLATLYIALDAQFAGLAQLLLYVGAIAILIVFAILLTPNSSETEARKHWSAAVVGVILSVGLFAMLAWAVSKSKVGHSAIMLATPQATMQQIGTALIEHYVLPLEVIGLMLTAALIGAVILAMPEILTAKERQTPR
jgi:NADH-quinone oxidoreductase subunit J